MEAGDMLFRNNPMSAVCSIVCNHEMQCAGHGIRGKRTCRCTFRASRTTSPRCTWTAWR
jgi:hypothetical protein